MTPPEVIVVEQQKVVDKTISENANAPVKDAAMAALLEAQALAGGPSLPPWLPAPGKMAVMGTSKLKDVDPCPQRTCIYSGSAGQAGLFAWSGAVYVPSLGTYGSILYIGGGHDDYKGNEVYRFDIETRLFTRITQPYSTWVIGPSGYTTDPITCEYYASTSGAVPGDSGPSQPFQNHTYASLVWVPGADAGNSKGYVFKGYQQWRIQAYAKQLHWFNLDTLSWERIGNVPSLGSFQNAPAVYDSLRKRLIRCSLGGPLKPFALPLSGPRVWTPFGLDGKFWSYDGNAFYSPGKDRLMITGDGMTLSIYDPMVSAPPITPTLLGPPPSNTTGGAEWVERKQSLYFYPNGSTTLYRLHPTNPADWSQPWQRTSETFTGPMPPSAQYPHRHYSRFLDIPPLDCFIWTGQVNAPAHAFKSIT